MMIDVPATVLKEEQEEPKKVVKEKEASTDSLTINVLPRPREEKAIIGQPPTFHVHHAVIGLGIAGASLMALAIPQLKPMTKVAIAGLGITIGALIVYDDVIQHWENNCDLSSIFNFTKCPERTLVVRKP